MGGEHEVQALYPQKTSALPSIRRQAYNYVEQSSRSSRNLVRHGATAFYFTCGACKLLMLTGFNLTGPYGWTWFQGGR